MNSLTPIASFAFRTVLCGTRRAIPRLTEKQEAKYWACVQKSGGCWAWLGSVDRKTGRGKFNGVGKKGVSAPRMAWALANGRDPGGYEVCHSCDNPNCVNPDHLWLGTHDDNMKDAARKSRFPKRTQTHCKRGHERTPENTYTRPDGGGGMCRACQAMRWRRQRVTA